MSAKPRRKIVAIEPDSAAAAGEQPKRRRLPSDERRVAILAEAAALFAEEGFGASTRRLASRLGITQAALYKHFRSKDEIVAALFQERAMRWRNEDWRAALNSNEAPLAERLGRLYAGYLGAITGRSMRLFVRAGLDGYGQPGRRGAVLTASILEPVIGALRREAGLADLPTRPMQHEEREIAMTLHGSLMFLAIRKHVYRMPLPEDLTEHAMRQVRLWLPGAIAEMRQLHASPPEEIVPQLAPRR
ncbi:helix-turn-helix domain-containing protein [Sinorhizobium sp. 8-89]|uniref:TetR/AcrR family transcriptional regulator n=1 Tax=Sinorhizobium sp. 7-81 TaxID=3049087 RepID=UPI0024C29785|nr:helix-turn-helix domain-containing protein [Sinorhizobium sp. 7-81]MDK1388832.1 helix-turn-helix domain-containing protein [Sinorhizobium sp. 7-81]